MKFPNFKVMSRYTLEEYLKAPLDVDTLVVSITDPSSPLVGEDFHADNISFLRLQFHDCEIDTKWETAMSDEQGEKVAEFIKDGLKNKNIGLIIVQCEAGCSRSAGVCAAIMKYITGDDMDIFLNPRYSPNMNCYRMVYNAFFDEPVNDKVLVEKAKVSDSVYFTKYPDFQL